MKHKRFLSMLVLLAAVVTGAWAQTETLLTTITGAGSNSNPATSANVSYSTEGVATLTFSEPTLDGNVAYNVSPALGWWGYDMTLTVTPAEGYTITKCVFYDNANHTATDSSSPFVVETTVEDKTPKVNGTILADNSKGITKIEVYGYVTPTATQYAITLADGTEDADKWTVKVGEGEAQAFPVEGPEGETVTVTYTGTKRVKSVKAVKKAEPATVPVTVTWNNDDITGSGKSFTKDGVTITAENINFNSKNFMQGGTFTTTLGNFTKIEVTAENVDGVSGTGWSGSDTKKTWTGNASSVSFSGDIMDMGYGNIKFVFTIEPTN